MKQIAKIPGLSQLENDSPEFNVWYKETIRVLISIFWEHSYQASDFRSIDYTLSVFSSSTPENAWQLRYLQWLKESKLLLESFLSELEDEVTQVSYDFWPLIDQKIVSVSKRLFDDWHYASAIFEAMKLVNNEVKDEVRIKGIWEYDGAPLMDKAFSINDPIISFWDTSTTTGKDIQQWYMHLYKWAMLAIRNPKWHDNVIISKERATHFIFIANHLLLQLKEKIN